MKSDDRPEAAVMLGESVDSKPSEYLTRSQVRDMGFPRRAVDQIFGRCPVIAIPGFSRPLIRRSDLDAFLAEHTFNDRRVRP